MTKPLRHPALLAILALAPLSGCGGGDPLRPTTEGRGAIQRLDLGASADLSDEGVVLADLPATEASGLWTGQGAEDVRWLRIPPSAERTAPEERVDALFIKGKPEDEPWTRHASVRVDLVPRDFNTVQVDVDLFHVSPDFVRVAFLNEGEVRYLTPAVEVSSKPVGPRPILFDLPQMRRAGGTIDELQVQFKGDVPEACVSRVVVHRQPLLRFAPGGTTTEPAMLVLETEGRSGRPLSSARPLETQVDVPEGAELAFSYAMVERLRMPGQKPRLVVEVEAEGCPSRRESYELENRLGTRATWHATHLSLEPFDGKRATLRFSLEVDGDHEGWAFVAEPVVRVKGATPPTVLLITSDTHRADHLGARLVQQADGVVLVKTPNLEALAGGGAHFLDAYTSTNVTNPSHVALMTGLGPRDTQIVNNHQPLVERATTVAELFRDAGFRTYASTSAFHLQHDESGLGQGFDRLDAPLRNRKNGWRWGGESVDRLETWMEEAAGQPLFVWLHVFDAHSPYKPPPEFDRRYWNGEGDPFDPAIPRDFPEIIDPPGRLKSLRSAEFVRTQYRAGVDYVDQQVGRVLSWPRMNDAMVAFTADHGECFGQNGVWFDHAELYPSSVHVPLILRGPGVAAGTVSDHPVRQIDVATTLLRMAGVEPGDFPGKDLRGALEPNAQKDARFMMAAHRMSVAIRSGKWHAILHLKDHREWSLEALKKKHHFELYDLEVDPSCSVNLAQRELRQARRLRDRLIQWVNSADGSGLGRDRGRTAEQAEALNAMGYSGEDEAQATFDADCDCAECKKFH